jgi:micrococcal nuclease
MRTRRYRQSTGAPDRIRTCDPGIRNPVLYPAELRARPEGHITGATSRPQGWPRRRTLLALAGVLALPSRIDAAQKPSIVQAIPEPGLLALADGSEVRLAGVLLPYSPGDGRALAARAKALLEHLVLGQEVVLETLETDRQGRVRAMAHTSQGRWLQGELVEAGLAWAWPEGSDEETARLERLEVDARARRAGLWASATLGEQSADRVRPFPSRFVVVVGRVHSVGNGRRWIYLNFGTDWRHDLTARLDRSERTRPWAAALDLATISGRLVRIRGWVFSWDGPMIELSRKGQLEILE